MEHRREANNHLTALLFLRFRLKGFVLRCVRFFFTSIQSFNTAIPSLDHLPIAVQPASPSVAARPL